MTSIDLANLDEAAYQALYNERIAPCFRENEKPRLDAVALFNKRIWIGGPIALAIAVVAAMVAQDVSYFFFFGIFTGVCAYLYAYSPLRDVGQKLKQDYCAAIAQAMGATFAMGGFVPPALQRLKTLRLVPGYDKSSFEDLFSGSYKDASFDLYEANLQKESRDSKGRKTVVTVFRGQLIRMAFPRKFLGITIVRRDAGVFNAFGGGQGLKKVGLEDPLFEKAFEVWGNDQVEARYILHPVLMQRLLDLETSFKGKKLRCAFEEGDMLVAIEGGNLFEPGDLFKTFDDPVRAKRVVDEIANVMRVMDQVLGAQARR